ncbi:MAG: DUF262 domain-containing protein [Gemmatimonadota bacterium]
MREIRGDARNIRTLLSGAKFSVDYYQREYRWESKQITELLEDLSEKFLESYQAGDERSAVEHYGHYFLGSIIISDKDGRKYIIDGQQRLTSLTLLLMNCLNSSVSSFGTAVMDNESFRKWLTDTVFALTYDAS